MSSELMSIFQHRQSVVSWFLITLKTKVKMTLLRNFKSKKCSGKQSFYFYLQNLEKLSFAIPLWEDSVVNSPEFYWLGKKKHMKFVKWKKCLDITVAWQIWTLKHKVSKRNKIATKYNQFRHIFFPLENLKKKKNTLRI